MSKLEFALWVFLSSVCSCSLTLYWINQNNYVLDREYWLCVDNYKQGDCSLIAKQGKE